MRTALSKISSVIQRTPTTISLAAGESISFAKVMDDLNSWENETVREGGPFTMYPRKPSEQRSEAAKRILDCFHHNHKNLDLSGLNLTSVPLLSYCFMRNVTHLNLSHNRLIRVPTEVIFASKLECLDLSHNELFTVSTSIPALPNLGQLNLSHNSLTDLPREFDRLTGLYDRFNLRHNLIIPPLPAKVTLRPDRHRDLILWHQRLDTIEDYQFRSTRNALRRRLIKLFTDIDQDDILRRDCIRIAADSIQSCEDRLSWGLNQMELARINRQAERGEVSGDEIFRLGRANWRLAKVTETANDRIAIQEAAGEHVDQLEVHLAYQINLREPLDLPVSVRTMRYRQLHNVHTSHLMYAANDILDAEKVGINRGRRVVSRAAYAVATASSGATPDLPKEDQYKVQPLAYSLAHYRPWVEHVGRENKERLEKLQEQAQDYVAGLTNMSDQRYKDACDNAMFLHNHGLAYECALDTISGKKSGADKKEPSPPSTPTKQTAR